MKYYSDVNYKSQISYQSFFLRHPCVFIKLLTNLQLVIKQFLSKNNKKKTYSKYSMIYSDSSIKSHQRFPSYSFSNQPVKI